MRRPTVKRLFSQNAEKISKARRCKQRYFIGTEPPAKIPAVRSVGSSARRSGYGYGGVTASLSLSLGSVFRWSGIQIQLLAECCKLPHIMG